MQVLLGSDDGRALRSDLMPEIHSVLLCTPSEFPDDLSLTLMTKPSPVQTDQQ
jgi:hypothetical protein